MLGGWKLKQTGRWFVSAVCVFVCVYEDRQAKGTLLSVVRNTLYSYMYMRYVWSEELKPQ